MARKKAPPPGYTERLRAVFDTRWGHILLRVGGLSLLFLVGGVVMRQARAQAFQMPEHHVVKRSLSFEGLPSWADARVTKNLENDLFYRDLSVSIFHPDAEARVRAVVTRHPMVRDVKRVEIVFPNEAIVTPALREPVAAIHVRVRDAHGREKRVARLLADDGALLPRLPYETTLKRRRVPLPRVVGIRALGTTEYGVVWEDRHDQVAEAVAAARVAARLYKDLSGRLFVDRIDVSRFPADSCGRVDAEVRLRAVVRPMRPGQKPRRVWLEWGRTERDRSDCPEEDVYAVKRDRLKDALARRELSDTINVRYPTGR